MTRGIGEFHIHDEAYKHMWISPDVTVLMETDHPKNDRPVIRIGPSKLNRIIYIQLGHGEPAHHNATYQELVRRAVLWAAGRLK